MASYLGVISGIYTPPSDANPPLELITDYNVIRGRYLGVLSVIDNHQFNPTLHAPIENYIIRQTRILYRQLWPSSGQRFPQ